VSWAAHELENFALQRKLGFRVSYLGLLVGALAPDVLTKLWTYGFTIGGKEYWADNPAQFHRGWPGMGWTTSLFAGVLLATLIYLVTRGNKPWALGVLIGYWAHAITDMFDGAGAMVLWPFSFANYSIGWWAYGAGEGKHGDAIAYYSSPGFLMDSLVLCLVIVFAWRVLSARYFWAVIYPVDKGSWDWIQRTFRMPERAMVAFYRAFFLYGACRIISWTLWVHVVERAPWDLSWGGPWWVEPFEPW
jgi:membrane-bound metal-dependent hydrolase YbcI (DUF457 family)